MKHIEIEKLSSIYHVRKLDKEDIKMIYEFCKSNTQYYEYCKKNPSIELIEKDLSITPPNIPIEQKYYIGFFDHNSLIAIMDLIDGYPNKDTAFIGFFMMNKKVQGIGVGSKIIFETLTYLKNFGFNRCQLGIDKENPQSNHFWRKNGFKIIKEIENEDGIILYAQREL